MSMSEWAKKEIYIAKKWERENSSDNEFFAYSDACYDSAYKAFKSLMEDGHSGMSIGITRDILIRLIDGKPLTPIEDTPDIWRTCWGSDEEGETKYQCIRQSSLFKTVYTDGRVEYKDIDRIVGINENTGCGFHYGLVTNYIENMIPPITFPYIPLDRPYKVYCSDFVYGEPETLGSYDRFAIHYMITPKGDRQWIKKYFKEVDGKMVAYSLKEYEKDYFDTFGADGDHRYD